MGVGGYGTVVVVKVDRNYQCYIPLDVMNCVAFGTMYEGSCEKMDKMV